MIRKVSQENDTGLTGELATNMFVLYRFRWIGDVGVYMRGRNDMLVKRTKGDQKWKEQRT